MTTLDMMASSGLAPGATRELRYSLQKAADKQFLVTAEEGTEYGSFGSVGAALPQDRGIPSDILRVAAPDSIIPHGARNLLHAKYCLDADGISERIK